MLQPSPSDQSPEAVSAAQRDKAAAASAVVLDPTWRAGKKLEEARKQLGLSLQEISERIRVRSEFLEALETMNVKLLPGKAYALAFLRSYAQVLGLNPNEIVDQFQAESALTREDAQKQIRNPASKPHPERPWLAAAALVLLAVGFVGWRALAERKPETAAAPEVNTRPIMAPADVAAAPAAGTETAARRVVEIRATAAGWLEARGPDGTVFLSRTMQPGEVYRPDASPGWTLHARDGAAFETFVNGVDSGPLGPPGKPVLGRSIDEIQPMAQAALSRAGG